ncbi:hypothetical protein [uncultured Aquimarina sp.]|uniref:hypothetical protein n=1 Tax=uncultured Aquimarina sp. TaxID=575652 RepID=UPI00260AD1F5|nr:hypothetical protein [uncultured Aquimarina sp.]
MNEGIIPILFGILFLIASLYNLKRYLSHKQGSVQSDAVVINVVWKPRSFHVKFDFLYDKEVAVVTYRFRLDTDWYEKTEEVFMQFRKGTVHEGSQIKLYIPNTKNPNKVTIIDPFKNKIKYMVFVTLMGLLMILIGSLAL